MRHKLVAAAEPVPALRASGLKDLASHALTDMAINCRSFGPEAVVALRLFNRISETGYPYELVMPAIDVNCIFCRIIAGELAAPIVFADETSIAFLDHRPVFPGHCLLVPRDHCETLTDLPANLVTPFFRNTQLLARGVELALEADGTFVAMNNRVSQSVAHLHVHIVPRRRKDGLRGFFWPRQKYDSDEQMQLIQKTIKSTIRNLRK